MNKHLPIHDWSPDDRPREKMQRLAHNHPSGNTSPSVSDQSLTKQFVKAGKNLDIKLLDHLIITENTYFSFADAGLL